MGNEKKSFILHYDKRDMLEELIDEEGNYERVGRLFMALCDFAEYGETDIALDFATRVAFRGLASQIQADREKYEEKCEKYRKNASLGGIAKATNRKQSLKVRKQSLPIVAYTDTDTDTVTDTDNETETDTDKYKAEFDRLWKIYPVKQGKMKALQAYIKARQKGESYEAVENGINNYIKQIQALKTEPHYIKHGSTWFYQNAWNDEYTTNNTPVYPPSELDEVF